jgi:hypothetical protein
MQPTSVKSLKGKSLVVAIALTLAGCAGGSLTTREKGTLGGAALGAGAGALIGEATDHSPGKGALIGGALGGLGGALVGGGMQSQDTELAEQQRDLERQRYELDRQRRDLDALRRDDDYYRRDDYYRPYGY